MRLVGSHIFVLPRKLLLFCEAAINANVLKITMVTIRLPASNAYPVPKTGCK